MEYQITLDGKRALIYGLGVTGRSAVRVLTEAGCRVHIYVDGVVSDREREELVALAGGRSSSITIEGEMPVPDPSSFDFLLKASGISPDRPLLQEARRRRLEVITDIEMAYRLFGGENMVAITGSNGKTTTTSLLTHLLRASGRAAEACGNIGIPVLTTMRDAEPGIIFVLECSSFQLENVRLFRPHRAAILNLSPDHIDWHMTYEAYADAKAHIARAQTPEDQLWIHPNDPEVRAALGRVGTSANIHPVRFDTPLAEKLRRNEGWALFGEHNVENAMFAAEIASDLGLDEQQIVDGLAGFHPVEHRMEYIATVNDVIYINDSKGTNVDATVRALSGIHQPVFLIAGGYDKHVSFEALYEAFRPHGKKMLLIGQTAEQIQHEAEERGLGDRVVLCGTLKKAMEAAFAEAAPGDMVLLSPASASWGQYHHFEERGDEFREHVLSWQKEQEEGK